MFTIVVLRLRTPYKCGLLSAKVLAIFVPDMTNPLDILEHIGTGSGREGRRNKLWKKKEKKRGEKQRTNLLMGRIWTQFGTLTTAFHWINRRNCCLCCSLVPLLQWYCPCPGADSRTPNCLWQRPSPTTPHLSWQRPLSTLRNVFASIPFWLRPTDPLHTNTITQKTRSLSFPWGV